MEAALRYHTDVVGMLLSRREGTQHAVDWQSYEGVVTCWLLAFGRAHHGWINEFDSCLEGWTNKRKPNRWMNTWLRLSREAGSVVQMVGRTQLV